MKVSKKVKGTPSKAEKEKTSRKISGNARQQKKTSQSSRSQEKKQVASEDVFNSTAPLPTAAEVLETVYLLVLENRKELTLLSQLDARKFFELIEKLLGVDPKMNNARRVHDGRRILQEHHPKETPPPLWTAWMESVYADRLADLMREISL